MRVLEHCEACHAPCGGWTVTRSMRRVANATLLRFDRYDEPPDSRTEEADKRLAELRKMNAKTFEKAVRARASRKEERLEQPIKRSHRRRRSKRKRPKKRPKTRGSTRGPRGFEPKRAKRFRRWPKNLQPRQLQAHGR